MHMTRVYTEEQKAAKRAYNAANKEHRSAVAKAHRELHRDEIAVAKNEYYVAHKEEIAARDKAYNSIHKVEQAVRNKAYRENNYARVTERQRAYYQLHKEEISAYNKAHPEIARRLQQSKRARRKGSVGKLTKGLTAKLFASQAGLCVYCRVDLLTTGHHLDHIMPLALGGR